ncbi:MAG TPA: 4-hydroxy-tetrahydrodipicolinate synthase [Candidatus Krumholzibacteria bacterium]|nr:4-hydroxy-tetrahydrodipicolinate synthase [Candidatus Krumholzibacteria bacterium]HPD71580.1 4-hydroxy-tetrahydrodipicolinate synthase [Candidatus Krumholzibacteria bacterium]HRY41487.1 4-hydroxy-tetrahydrodipicolinate synthase [Candidatus Krumholzibacteria bacterium]
MTRRTRIREGIYTALVTPFTSEGGVDRAAWPRLVQRQVAAGVAGVVPLGCTGEAAVLERDEREYLVRSAVEICAGRCLVVAGSGTNSTARTVEQTREVKIWGADAAMIITPYYNKPQQHGLVAHYRTVARAVDLPVVLYNVPGRTACNLLPGTAAELAGDPNIVAIKEASGNLDQIERVIAQTDLQVFSGDDALNFSIFGLGACGAVSVVSNLLPGSLVAMWNAWRQGDVATAWKLSRLLAPTGRACFIETSPAPVKELLSLAGLCRREPRLPLMPVTEDSVKYLVQFYESTLADLIARDLEVRG